MTSNMIRVSAELYQALRTESLKYQFELNRQISMGKVITAAWQVAKSHPDELRQILARNK
jgi:hypothetical protein